MSTTFLLRLHIRLLTDRHLHPSMQPEGVSWFPVAGFLQLKSLICEKGFCNCKIEFWHQRIQGVTEAFCHRMTFLSTLVLTPRKIASSLDAASASSACTPQCAASCHQWCTSSWAEVCTCSWGISPGGSCLGGPAPHSTAASPGCSWLSSGILWTHDPDFSFYCTCSENAS